MTISEWIWTKIGFGLIGAIAGSVWAVVFFPFLSAIKPDISLKSVFIIFISLFSIVGLFNEKFIGKSGLGAIYALIGIFYGFIAQGGDIPSSDISWKEHGKEMIACFFLGMVSTLILVGL